MEEVKIGFMDYSASCAENLTWGPGPRDVHGRITVFGVAQVVARAPFMQTATPDEMFCVHVGHHPHEAVAVVRCTTIEHTVDDVTAGLQALFTGMRAEHPELERKKFALTRIATS